MTDMADHHKGILVMFRCGGYMIHVVSWKLHVKS